MAVNKSEIATMLPDQSIEVTVFTVDGEVSRHGSFKLTPATKGYAELKVGFQLDKRETVEL